MLDLELIKQKRNLLLLESLDHVSVAGKRSLQEPQRDARAEAQGPAT